MSHNTCGSGGCWTSAPYTYTQTKAGEDILGAYTPPEQLTVAKLLVEQNGTLQADLQAMNVLKALAIPTGKQHAACS
jgi:hypothetical protein